MVCKYYTLHTSILATKKLKWRYFFMERENKIYYCIL
nr:MAG TPA: hypothetical protein [Caudoviricetes sp.]